MLKIKDNIYEAIENSEIQIEEICIQDCDDIRKKICQKYCRNAGKSDVLWDDLLEYSSIFDADAWKLFKCMIKRECILFLINLTRIVCLKLRQVEWPSGTGLQDHINLNDPVPLVYRHSIL